MSVDSSPVSRLTRILRCTCGLELALPPGIIRLLIETGLLGFAAWAWFDLGIKPFAWIFLITLVLHYIASYDRIIWLWGRTFRS